MRKRHYVAAAGAIVGILIGGGVARHEVQNDPAKPCRVPLTMLQSDYNQLTLLTDKFVGRHFNRQYLEWAVVSSDVTPTRVEAVVVVGRAIGGDIPGNVNVQEGIYTVVLTRDCVNGAWKIASFEPQGGKQNVAPPQSG